MHFGHPPSAQAVEQHITPGRAAFRQERAGRDDGRGRHHGGLGPHPSPKPPDEKQKDASPHRAHRNADRAVCGADPRHHRGRVHVTEEPELGGDLGDRDRQTALLVYLHQVSACLATDRLPQPGGLERWPGAHQGPVPVAEHHRVAAALGHLAHDGGLDGGGQQHHRREARVRQPHRHRHDGKRPAVHRHHLADHGPVLLSPGSQRRQIETEVLLAYNEYGALPRLRDIGVAEGLPDRNPPALGLEQVAQRLETHPTRQRRNQPRMGGRVLPLLLETDQVAGQDLPQLLVAGAGGHLHLAGQLPPTSLPDDMGSRDRDAENTQRRGTPPQCPASAHSSPLLRIGQRRGSPRTRPGSSLNRQSAHQLESSEPLSIDGARGGLMWEANHAPAGAVSGGGGGPATRTPATQQTREPRLRTAPERSGSRSRR